MQEQEKDYTTPDIYISDFLALRGINPRHVKQNGKIIFRYHNTSRSRHALSEIGSSAMVEASKLNKAVKYMRGQMYTVSREKEMGNGNIKAPLSEAFLPQPNPEGL